MENMKMSDVFCCEVDASNFTVNCGVVNEFADDGVLAHELTAKAVNNYDRLVEENAELRKALELMVDFAEGQMHPEQNDPSMFDDEDFGSLNHAKQLLNK